MTTRASIAFRVSATRKPASLAVRLRAGEGVVGRIRSALLERLRQIRAALEDVRDARDELRSTKSDFGDLKDRAMNLSQKAMEKLMSNEKRAMQVAEAIGAAQRGKQAFDKGQDELLKALNVASKTDFKAVGKQLSALKRRLRDLEEKLGGQPG